MRLRAAVARPHPVAQRRDVCRRFYVHSRAPLGANLIEHCRSLARAVHPTRGVAHVARDRIMFEDGRADANMQR